MAPLIATTNPRSTVRERFIDLEYFSLVESEEEEEKDGYTVYGKTETLYSEEENNPEPRNVRTSLRSMLTSGDVGGSVQMM